MRILWINNIMLPAIAESLGLPFSEREGWLSGQFNSLIKKADENNLSLGVCFPFNKNISGEATAKVNGKTYKFRYYGFEEDLNNPHKYDKRLEGYIKEIYDDFKPDAVHIFGTEFPHAYAAAEAISDKDRLFVGIQGLCSVLAKGYLANLPDYVCKRVTFRDFIKRDTVMGQKEKFVKRGNREVMAVNRITNIGGRTKFDMDFSLKWHPQARYFKLNETLRDVFYTYEPKYEQVSYKDNDYNAPYKIFLSQGDYPLKGLHYLLRALPAIKERFPFVKLIVAGNVINRYGTVKEKIKISSYGLYINELIEKKDLKDSVIFTGRLKEKEMAETLYGCDLYVNCSTLENSPNSLGEAMLMGVPCVAALVGGIPSMFANGIDGVGFTGFNPDNPNEENGLERISEALSQAVTESLENRKEAVLMARNARAHALDTHDANKNLETLISIYKTICGDSNER